MNEFTAQLLAYLVVFIMLVGLVSVLLRGFFWKYLRVRGSLGRLVLLKARGLAGDSFTVAKPEEGFLSFKLHGKKLRLPVKEQKYFYRCMGVAWIDYDEQTGAVVAPDFSAVGSYDAEKVENLLIRALTRPLDLSNKEIIIIILLLAALIAIGGSIYMGYMNYKELQILKAAIKTTTQTITPGI